MGTTMRVLATVDLVEGVESARMESEVVSDRGVLDTGLEHGLADVVCNGLATLFLVLPVSMSCGSSPKSYKRICLSTPNVPCSDLQLVMLRERLPRLSTFTLGNNLKSPLRLTAHAQAEHVVQLPAPHLL